MIMNKRKVVILYSILSELIFYMGVDVHYREKKKDTKIIVITVTLD